MQRTSGEPVAEPSRVPEPRRELGGITEGQPGPPLSERHDLVHGVRQFCEDDSVFTEGDHYHDVGPPHSCKS